MNAQLGFPQLRVWDPLAIDVGVDVIRRLRVTGAPLSTVIDDVKSCRTGVDDDGDSVFNELDACPASDLSQTVVIGGEDSGVENDLLADGCTIADLTADALEADLSRMDFVQLLLGLKADGDLTGQELGAILKTLNSP